MIAFSGNCLLGGRYLVTGASSGIGRATALLIAECGGSVIAAGRDESRLCETIASLPRSNEHVYSVQSFADADQTAEWTKRIVQTYGTLTGVFHSAGIELVRPVRMTKQANIEDVFGSSVYASFGIARAVSQKNAIVDGGSVVFMSSVAGSVGQIGMTAYSAAKASVDGLMRSFACEMASRGVRVNTIAAGAVKTAMHQRITQGAGDDAESEYAKSHLLGFGNETDVANAVVFLMSDASRWITGSVLAVDGGYMVR